MKILPIKANIPPVKVADPRISDVLDARVVFLTHYIPLHQVPVLQLLSAAVRDFRVLLSTPIEPNRHFDPDWSGLNISVQKTLTMRRIWKHPEGGFSDDLFVHIPYDTLSQLRRLKPDIVLSVELGARSVGAALYRRLSHSSKLVLLTAMSERTEQGRGAARYFLRKQLLQQVDAVTYNGPSCLKYLSQFSLPQACLFPLPYAADDRTLDLGPVNREDQTTRHRFIIVGQLSERKGVLSLVQRLAAYCRLNPHRTIEAIFAGDGPLRGQLESISTPINLKLTFPGHVPSHELSSWMKKCGATIAPTLADEWLMVVNEALHAGLPVIGSIHAQAVITLIKDGVNGYQYDPYTPGSIVNALDEYFKLSSDEIETMRVACRESVSHLTPSHAAACAIDVMKYALNK